MNQLISNIKTDWKDILLKLYRDDLDIVFEEELEVLPPKHLIFNAFNHFNFEDTKVVIIGQDCYPTPKHAMGLCFSVPNDIKCAASLRNIFKELEYEYGQKRTQTDLTDWAQQGVLLLNCALTVREYCAGSHLKYWKPYTTDIVKYIATHKKNIVYMLWGRHAQQFEEFIDPDCNCILKSIHPSPLASRSGSFVGNGHFQKANEYLQYDIKWI